MRYVTTWKDLAKYLGFDSLKSILLRSGRVQPLTGVKGTEVKGVGFNSFFEMAIAPKVRLLPRELHKMTEMFRAESSPPWFASLSTQSNFWFAENAR